MPWQSCGACHNRALTPSPWREWPGGQSLGGCVTPPPCSCRACSWPLEFQSHRASPCSWRGSSSAYKPCTLGPSPMAPKPTVQARFACAHPESSTSLLHGPPRRPVAPTCTCVAFARLGLASCDDDERTLAHLPRAPHGDDHRRRGQGRCRRRTAGPGPSEHARGPARLLRRGRAELLHLAPRRRVAPKEPSTG